MKKIILFAFTLVTVLLIAVFVYANRGNNKPVREYIECKPAPVIKPHQAASSSSLTFSLLVL